MSSTPLELIAKLDYQKSGPFPKAAVEEIIARKEEMIPHLLDILDAALADPKLYLDDAKSMHCYYALFLLAQFREKRAYRPLMAMLHLESQISEEIFGDLITEDISNIIASVYDGDDEPLKHLIEDPSAYEYARACAGLGTYIVLFHQEVISLDYLEGYFRELFQGKLEREFSHVWSSLCSICGDLAFASLLPEVRQAFEEELCDHFFDRLESIEERIKEGRIQLEGHDTGLIDDAISRMENWSCFHPETSRLKLLDSMFPPELISRFNEYKEFRASSPVKPHISQKPSIGRNDPCLCGSGRKFKKCCGS
jgi:Protein of unknown function (DUF1186)/SEC-C motif